MILYVFLDGVGLGKNDPTINPCTKFAKSFFCPMGGLSLPLDSPFKKAYYIPTDASMGKAGLPQSATGQTALWTGINTVEILNRHVSGYPSFTLKKIISQFSVIKVLKEHGYKSSFLNCYSPPFLEKLETNSKHLSASTLVQLASGNPLRLFKDLENFQGLFMDITHRVLQEFGKTFLESNHPLMQLRDPFEMGKLAVRLARQEDLTLYEYFLTDKVGHAMDWELAEKIIQDIEAFMEGIANEINFESELLIVCSDHGNFEDLSCKLHTSNKVPTVLYGKKSEQIKNEIKNLADIVPAIYKILGLNFKPIYLPSSQKKINK